MRAAIHLYTPAAGPPPCLPLAYRQRMPLPLPLPLPMTDTAPPLSPACTALNTTGIQVYVVESPRHIADALLRLRNSMLDRVVAIDLEWRPETQPGRPSPVAMMQARHCRACIMRKPPSGFIDSHCSSPATPLQHCLPPAG